MMLMRKLISLVIEILLALWRGFETVAEHENPVLPVKSSNPYLLLYTSCRIHTCPLVNRRMFAYFFE